MKEINSNAKVKALRTVEINADIRKVWQLLADIDNWKNWNSGITKSSFNGTPKAGDKFHWKTGGTNLQSEIHTYEPFRKFGWTGKVFGVFAIHNWKLNENNGITTVIVEESIEGFLTKILPNLFQKSLEKGMDSWLQDLKKEAEK